MDSKRIVAESGFRRVPVPTVYYTDPDPQYWNSGRVEVLVDYRYRTCSMQGNGIGWVIITRNPTDFQICSGRKEYYSM